MIKNAVPLALMFLLAASLAGAKETVSRREILKKEKKLEDVKRQIREEEKTLKAVSEKETGVLGEIEGINKNITAARQELEKVDGRLRSIQRDVLAAQDNIARLKKDIEALSDKLASRLKAMYKMRRGEAIDVLFSPDSAGIGRRHKYLTMIMDSDASLIEGYEKSLLRLNDEKKRLDALYRDMGEAKKDVLVKKGEAESLHRNRRALLSDIKNEKERRQKLVKELEGAERELSSLLEKLRGAEDSEGVETPSTGFGSMKGRLKRPVEGSIVSLYGKVKHPRYQTVTFNNGIIIEAPVGSAVKSVYEGKVAYTGWLKGYGQIMIIDHRGGYYTLYAYLSKFLKERGEAVGRGDEIAQVGDTGPSAAGGLYFEIRLKGVPRDPMPWLSQDSRR